MIRSSVMDNESDVIDVLDLMATRQVPVWVAGGWGIDALIGRKTRDHMDLDLACRAEDETTIINALQERGYRIVLAYRPARLALADDRGCEVDLHPVRFGQRGFEIQQGLRPGEQFHYPPDAFVTGGLA
jgi:lincosamide nucleotidyltransferase A/C/D/E